MLRKALAIITLLVALCALAYAQEAYTVSGELIFSQGDTIILSLYTKEGFRNYKNRPLPPAPFTQKIAPSAEQKKAGKAPFEFFGIPEGTFCILAFRDLNRNSEPGVDRQAHIHGSISSYKVTGFSGNWDEIKFRVDRNISGIRIEFVNGISTGK